MTSFNSILTSFGTVYRLSVIYWLFTTHTLYIFIFIFHFLLFLFCSLFLSLLPLLFSHFRVSFHLFSISMSFPVSVLSQSLVLCISDTLFLSLFIFLSHTLFSYLLFAKLIFLYFLFYYIFLYFIFRIREATTKALFLVVGPLRRWGVGKAGPLRKKTF